ncbi:hypothetical protein ACVWYG_003710 [Pedobacter sp. UYEF25]
MKTPTIVLFFVMVCSNVFGQKLNGDYVVSNQLLSERSTEFKFTNGLFTYSSKGNLAVEKRGVGRYQINGKKLILHYSKVPNQDSSYYHIKSKGAGFSSGNVLIKIKDDEDQPMQAWILLTNKQKEVIALMNTSDIGESNLMLYDAFNTGFLEIGFLGYNSVLFPVKKLLGKQSELLVKLSWQKEIYLDAHVEVYELSFLNDKSISLTSKETGRLILKINKSF